MFRDTSERRISYEKVEARWKKMYTDTLVGIGNSRFCEKEQDKCLVEFHRHGVPFTAAVCEVDGFRDLIEKYGPEQGDDILRMVGRTLSNILLDDDLLENVTRSGFSLFFPLCMTVMNPRP
ncbi:MAG: GGDEF domain-containing protein [Spirochaetales bacterium]|nr:GGDEF domain-containing protein [Spirochaetales bacterium]